MHIEKLVVGSFQENAYIVYNKDNREAVIIDPGDESQKIKEHIDRLGLTLLAILNTHAHVDHVGAVSDLQEWFDAPFYLHEQEKDVLNRLNDHCAMFGLPVKKEPNVAVWLTTDETITIGSFSIKIIHTPGHTPGGVCYIIDGHCFVGDTIFKGSVGRTDLPGGSWDILEGSLRKIIQEVPKEMIIHSGHGFDTTLAEEYIDNPFLHAIVF